MEDYARTAIPEEGFKGNLTFCFFLSSIVRVARIIRFHARRNRTPPQLKHIGVNCQVPKHTNSQHTHTQNRRHPLFLLISHARQNFSCLYIVIIKLVRQLLKQNKKKM
jgi:hypothetical protein